MGSETPVIYAFANSIDDCFAMGVALAEDGVVLGGHACSSEGFIPHDLGVIEGARSDRHEAYAEHYPDGYRMEFVRSGDIKSHTGLQAAIAAFEARRAEEPSDDA